MVWNEPFTFVDEIEVYGGEPAWLDEPLTGPAVSNPQAYSRRLAIEKDIRTKTTFRGRSHWFETDPCTVR